MVNKRGGKEKQVGCMPRTGASKGTVVRAPKLHSGHATSRFPAEGGGCAPVGGQSGRVRPMPNVLIGVLKRVKIKERRRWKEQREGRESENSSWPWPWPQVHASQENRIGGRGKVAE